MSDKFKDVIADVRQNKFNHHNLQYLAIARLEKVLGGDVTIMEASSPLVNLIEHNTALCAANNIEVDSLFRDLTRDNAKSIADLVRFVDMDVKNLIRATPSSAPFTIAMRVADIMNLGVVLPNGARRIIIPEDSVIGYRDEIFFGIHHAIEITAHSHDNIDVRYLDNTNPLKELDNPVLDINYRYPRDLSNSTAELLLEINLEAYQFRRKANIYSINKAAGFSENFVLDGDYYHVRVFNRTKNGWRELATEMSEFAYNPSDSVGVAVVDIKGVNLNVSIPQIYLTRGIISNQVRVVVYTTNGKLTKDFSITTNDDFSIEFHNNNPQHDQYVGPLRAFGTLFVYSLGKTTGGVNMPTVDELRKDLNTLNTDNSIPITRGNLNNTLIDMGYDLVHEFNYIDKNLYLASKRLAPLVIGAADIQVGCGSVSVLLQDLSDKYGVLTHGDNYVITPNLLAKYEYGKVNLLSNGDAEKFLGLTVDRLVTEVNESTYLTTPLYTLIERSMNTRESLVFDLSTPSVTTRRFIKSNERSEGLISTKSYTFSKVGDEYILELTAVVNDTFLQYLDNSFIPQLRTENAYGHVFGMNGEFVDRGDDGEFIFKFVMHTNYNLGIDGTIVLDTLSGPSGDFHMPLTNTFDLTYNLVKSLPAIITNDLKENTIPELLPEYYQTITHETLTIKVGDTLPEIYTPTKTLAGSIEYQKYQEDVLAFYDKDEYETDAQNYIVFTRNPEHDPNDPNSQPFEYKILHHKGDPVLKADGTQEVRHFKGDVILDDKGEPIPVKRQPLSIESRLILVDYKYLLSGDYVDNLRREVVENIYKNIRPLESSMLDGCELRYNLSNCLGDVSVRHDRNRSLSIPAGLSFDFIVNVDKVTYGDIQVRNVITDSIKRITSKYLRNRGYARNELIALINEEIKGSVDSFDIKSIAGRDDIVGFNIEDSANIIGIAGRAYIGTDGAIALTDAIDVVYEVV